MTLIPVDFLPLGCPHCRQVGVDSRVEVKIHKGQAHGFLCPACRSFWESNGVLTQSPRQPLLRKLIKRKKAEK